MATRYRIIGWNDYFETASSRKLRRPYWLSIPTKQSGKGFTRIMVQADGAAIFGLWILIAEACSAQLPPRLGWLTDDGTAGGHPWTAEDLAERWRRQPAEVERALHVLCSPGVGWIQVAEDDGKISRDDGKINRCLVESGQVRSSQGGACAGAQPPPPGIDAIETKEDRRRALRIRLARLRFASGDTELEEWAGLLTNDARCGDQQEALECLSWLKQLGRREGIASRFAGAYEALALRWHQQQHGRPAAGQA